MYVSLLVAALVACRETPTSLVETTVAPATTSTTIPTTTTTAPPPVQVSGKVTSPDGLPVSGATVRMGELASLTGADGWFSFETATPTSMQVSKPGWGSAEVDWDETVTFFETSIAPVKVRGLRVGADAAGNDDKFASLLALADATAVNTFVFDTKQEGGDVLYATEVLDAHDVGAVRVLYDPVARIAEAKEHGLYAITRIVSFEDSKWAAARPVDKMAGPWIDPQSEAMREYLLALAIEACEIGFDEIQFDYIRYPSGSTASLTGQLDMTQDERVAVIASFLNRARAVLHPMGCAVSADVFGIVASTLNDQGLGQRPEELSAELDALSPMVYPSHYSNGWLGFADPNDHPYDVTTDAITDALPRMADESQLRPWLQAFWWTNDQIRRSIQAAEDAGVGWILWNARSNFDASALPTDAEVAP